MLLMLVGAVMVLASSLIARFISDGTHQGAVNIAVKAIGAVLIFAGAMLLVP